MGVSLVITSANVTEIPYYMKVLKIVVSAMFGFRRFIQFNLQTESMTIVTEEKILR